MFRIVRFYVPLGISSLLAGLTHVIINGVLARSDHPEVAISSYAVALSLSFLMDMPMNALRQASSRFSRTRVSFRAVAKLGLGLAGILLVLSAAIGWTPAGSLLFRYAFGVSEQLLDPTVKVYQVLAPLYAFTAMRSLFQGVIISQLRTGWMTVGMAIRVALMAGMSWYFIHVGWTNDGRIGAWIFMTGILVECVVAVGEGLSLKNRLPDASDHDDDGGVQKVRDLFPFYVPLLYSSLATVLLQPSVQAALNMSADPTLSVASYAVTLQLANMIAWFCASIHQIVIQFYAKQRRHVLLLVAFLSVLSPLVLLSFSVEPCKSRLLEGVLGIRGALLDDVIVLLRFMAVQSFFFPWLDFVLGLTMLKGRTKAALAGRICAVSVSIALLFLLVFTVPAMNGMIAGLVTAVVAPLELLVVWLWLRRLERIDPAVRPVRDALPR